MASNVMKKKGPAFPGRLGSPDMVLRDQRENRMIPVEIKIVNIGFIVGENMIHSLPPRPPMSLSDVEVCTPDEIYRFTQRPEFFRPPGALCQTASS